MWENSVFLLLLSQRVWFRHQIKTNVFTTEATGGATADHVITQPFFWTALLAHLTSTENVYLKSTIFQKKSPAPFFSFQCGHCYCVDCMGILLSERDPGAAWAASAAAAAPGTGRVRMYVRCPTCRCTTKHSEISYVDTTWVNIAICVLCISENDSMKIITFNNICNLTRFQ